MIALRLKSSKKYLKVREECREGNHGPGGGAGLIIVPDLIEATFFVDFHQVEIAMRDFEPYFNTDNETIEAVTVAAVDEWVTSYAPDHPKHPKNAHPSASYDPIDIDF